MPTMKDIIKQIQPEIHQVLWKEKEISNTHPLLVFQRAIFALSVKRAKALPEECSDIDEAAELTNEEYCTILKMFNKLRSDVF